MNLDRILPYARTLLERAVSKGDVVIDATVGNGHDTLYLAQLVGENGRVYGFDIQKEAIDETAAKLEEHELRNRVLLFQHGHEMVDQAIPPVHDGAIAAAVFNLGYLPGGDESIITRPRTTITAVEKLMDMVKPGGIIVLVIYHGHPEGAVERDYLLRFVQTIDSEQAHVLRYQFMNTQTPSPFVVAIEKRGVRS
ncbi:methyltransferase domain-containing protein [Jeotgalibacillus sp. S-D1]|uniref:tRNA (mnm(5)s(2)U34)-methyltransferase n=1 Tax=Jeotgalibacillus sp. S-D1 TaxID=2552189 RepID=UPI0010594B3D|nr:class I SAM-dependent methyltransferase [Jeotgalibacillus sp. S-D1]TDL34222.1 methyltransferase domain-containing protein [Jeotgalibacillus sp. S-D1]